MLETKPASATKPLLNLNRSNEWAVLLSAVAVATIVAVVALTQSFRLMPDDPPIYDPDIYVAMAQSQFNPLSHVPPFVWRILSPLVVSWLPLPTLTGFFILTLLSLVGCGWLLYKICLVLKVPHPLWAIPLFFSCHYASAFLIQNYMLVDPECLFFILLAGYALFTRRPWLYIVALVVGALNKETILAVALAGLFYQHPAPALLPSVRWWQRRWWLVVGAGSAVMVVVALRWLIPGNGYSVGEEISKIISLRLAGHWSRQLFSIVALSFGPIIVLLGYRPRHSLAWLRQHPVLTVYLMITTAQVLIASQNARLVVYGFVTIIPLVLVKLDLLAQRLKWKPLYLYSSILVIQLSFYALLWSHLLYWN